MGCRVLICSCRIPSVGLTNSIPQCRHLMMNCPTHSKSFIHTWLETDSGWYIVAFQKPPCLWYIWINMSCSVDTWHWISFSKQGIHRDTPSDISWNVEEIAFCFTNEFIIKTHDNLHLACTKWKLSSNYVFFISALSRIYFW